MSAEIRKFCGQTLCFMHLCLQLFQLQGTNTNLSNRRCTRSCTTL